MNMGLLESILKRTHPEDCVSGFFTTASGKSVPSTEDELRIWTYHRPQSGLTDIKAVVNYASGPREVMPPSKIQQLAEEFGGDYFISISLYKAVERGQGSGDFIVSDDSVGVGGLSIFGRKHHPIDREEEEAAWRYRSKELHEQLFQLFGVEYQVRDEKIFIAEQQPPLRLTPATITEAYSLLYQTGDLPWIGNGSRRRSFNLFQHPRRKKLGEIATSLHLSVGDGWGVDGSLITSEEISQLEETLCRHGIALIEGERRSGRELKYRVNFEYGGGPPI